MVLRYVCSRCGYVLYEFRKDKEDYRGILEPQEVAALYRGVCPNCFKRLETNVTIDKVRIKPRGGSR